MRNCVLVKLKVGSLSLDSWTQESENALVAWKGCMDYGVRLRTLWCDFCVAEWPNVIFLHFSIYKLLHKSKC